MFIEVDDYKAVADDRSLEVIHQSDPVNLERSQKYAIEEVSGYLRSRYDVTKAFTAEGDDRNQQLVMITCDVALYHLIAWLPKRIGFEIRDIRYKRAIEWLESVQAGKVTPDLPPLIDPDTGDNIGNPIKWGSMTQSKYDY